MKGILKVLYLAPAVLYCGFLGWIGLRLGFEGFTILPFAYALLLVAAAVLLCIHKWWGCIPGMAVGGIIIYLFETSHVHHHLNETQIGLVVTAYFTVMGLFCYLFQKRN